MVRRCVPSMLPTGYNNNYQIIQSPNSVAIVVEMNHDTPEVVDLNFQQLPVDQAMRTLSPSVRFYYRADLSNSERYPIRLALPAPAARAGGPD